ncbi:hypothetical protein GmHk_06G017371 [Glycine max]|nr:hypothetical protein GmHk_06G017371 [Glycine max]
MQVALQNQTKERPQLPPKMCKRGDLSIGHKHDCSTTLVRSRPGCTRLNNRPGSIHCGFVVPKMPQGNKEVLKRALSPPPTRRIGLRWLNFRPTPSKLSNIIDFNIMDVDNGFYMIKFDLYEDKKKLTTGVEAESSIAFSLCMHWRSHMPLIKQGPGHVPLGLLQIASPTLTSENTDKGKQIRKDIITLIGWLDLERYIKLQVY